MIIINKNNYESFAIDYIEGNLDKETKNAFELFLDKNRDIRVEIEKLYDINIIPENITFENKIELKKSPLDEMSYFEYLAISDIEKTISKAEKNELQNILTTDNHKIEEYKLFSNTVLLPEKISFPNKSEIKKSKIFNLQNLQRAVTSVAAILLVFIGIKFIQKDNYFLFTNSRTELIQDSFAQAAVNSKYEILSIRKVSEKNNFYIKKNNASNNHFIYKKKYLAKTESTKLQKTDSIASFVENDNNTEIVANIPMDRLDLSLNEKNLPKINHVLGQQYVSPKNSLFSSLKKINAVNILNFAFRSFDVMTESNLDMKLKVSNKRKIKIDIKQKTYTLALK